MCICWARLGRLFFFHLRYHFYFLGAPNTVYKNQNFLPSILSVTLKHNSVMHTSTCKGNKIYYHIHLNYIKTWHNTYFSKSHVVLRCFSDHRCSVYACLVKKKLRVLPWEDEAFELYTLQVGRKKERKCVDASSPTLQCCSEVSAKDK